MKKKPLPVHHNEAKVESMMQVREKELINSDKMTKNLFYEYEVLQKRYERMSDPLYINELRRKSVELDSRIRALNRDQKNLSIHQYRREKRLDKIIRTGEPENLKDVVMTQKTLQGMVERLRVLQEQYRRAMEAKDTYDSNFKRWSDNV